MAKEYNNPFFKSDSGDINSKGRKTDHIEMAFDSQVSRHNIDNRFYYEPLLKAHPKNTKNNISFLGKTFSAPIWVSSMTGGTTYARIINANLAKVCKEFGLGMGLGSCRSLLYGDETFEDFNVRRYIGDQPLFANLGIAQVEELVKKNEISKIDELLNKLSADGLIIHVNPLQEWLQPEGDKINQPPIATIKKLIDATSYKIIVKEVGQGMGYESLKSLFKLPLAAIEFAANGGTNFAKLEMMRAPEFIKENFKKLASIGHCAAEMTRMSNHVIEELGKDCLCKQVIVSGGVKDFLDGYYYIEKLNTPAIYGQASSFLKYAKEDYEQLCEYVALQIRGFELARTYLRIKDA